MGASTATCLESATRLERRAHGDFGLAVSHVAAEQAIHRRGPFHVALDVGDGGGLIGRLGKFEGILELALPGRVRRKTRNPGAALRSAYSSSSLSARSVSDFCTRDLRAAQAVPPSRSSCGLAPSERAVRLHQVHALERHVQPRVVGVSQAHELAAAARRSRASAGPRTGRCRDPRAPRNRPASAPKNR